MTPTGERVVFGGMQGSESDYETLLEHLSRYLYAMRYVRGKKVIDAACGTGYGAWLLSLGASEVYAADIDAESLKYAQKNLRIAQGAAKVTLNQKDLNKDELPEADICVSLETIEHLTDPEFFLKNLKCKELIFSFPVNHKSEFHKQVFESAEAGYELLEDCGWNINKGSLVVKQIDFCPFVLGRATR